MMKSARVTLTVLAGIGSAAHAQLAPNPCAPGTFNPAGCQAAVRSHGYCDNGASTAAMSHTALKARPLTS